MKKIKMGIQLEQDVHKKLDSVVYLTKKSKTYYINNALNEYLDKVIQSKGLKEKVDFLLKESDEEK